MRAIPIPCVAVFLAGLAAVVPVLAAVPGVPTHVLAIPGNARATIHLAPPASDGGFPITSYTITASPGGATATAPAWPIVVTGLANGTSYTFTARATNASGNSAASAASNPVTPALPTIPPAVVTNKNLSMALDASGQVYAWGADDWGQLGQGRPLVQSSPVQVPGLPTITHIALNSHALAVDSTGQVWSWGDGSCGQLGPRDHANTALPARVIGATGVVQVAAGICSSWALKSDGTVLKWGNYGQPVHQVPGLKEVTRISAHGEHVLAIQGLGVGSTVWAYGDNYFAQLGQGGTLPVSEAVPVPFPADVYGVQAISAGVDGSAAIVYGDAGLELFFWGRFNYGTTYASPAPVTGLTNAIRVSLINGGMAALRDDRTVWKWTSNLTAPTQFAGIFNAAEIEYSDNFGYIDTLLEINLSNALVGKGNNNNGQLGQGHTNPVGGPVIVPGFSANTVQACIGWQKASVLALKSDGSVWFWGLDGAGLAGNGRFVGSSVPLAVPIPATIKAIAAGENFGIGLDTAGQAWGWGSNQFAQFDATRVNRPTASPIAGASNVAAIAAGGSFIVAIAKNDGTAWSTYAGGLAQAPGLTNVVKVAASYNTVYFLRGDGVLHAMGYNLAGEVGDGTFIQRDSPVPVTGISGVVTKVAAQASLAAALMQDGRVYAWGYGGGIANFPGVNTPFLAPGIGNAVDVEVARSGILIRLADGSMRGWGFGTYHADVVGIGPSTLTIPDGPVQAMALDTLGFTVGKTGLLWGWGLSGAPPTYGTVGDGTYIARSRPVVVFAHDGSGSLDGNNWYLDLQPGSAESIPAASVPEAIATSQLSGAKEAYGLHGTVKYRTADIGKNVNNYVLGLVPPAFLGLVKSAPGTSSKDRLAAKAAKAGGFVLVQLTPAGWTDVNGQLIAYSQGVANAAGGASNILNGLNSTLVPGARFCVGYGESADAMLGSASLRAVLEIEGATATSSGVPCVLSGIYVNGPASSVQSTAVSFAASVVGINPTGSVQFRDVFGGSYADIGSATMLAASNPAVGTASVTTSSLAIGAHSITANYSGDGLNPAATPDTPRLHVVSAALASTAVALDGPASSALGAEVVFTALVTGAAPTGTVQFLDGATPLGAPVALVEGAATLRSSALAAGSHSITASYSGDAQNTAGTSPARTHLVVNALVTAVTLASSANPAPSGALVTLTTAVTGNGTPSGNVTLRKDGSALGTTSLTAGAAAFPLPSLASGLHRFAVDYSGDGMNTPASSATLFQEVAAPPPFFTATVAKGGTGSGTVTSNPAGLSCGSTCSSSFASGTVVTLTAATAAGSVFSGWSGACTGAGNCVVTMNAARSVTATFTATFVLQVGKAGTGSGTVTSTAPAGTINCGATCSATFDSGTAVTLAAAASAGSTFTGWTGACTGTGTCVVTMDAAKNVTATFVTSAALGVSPSSLDFGGQSMGTTSGAKTVTVSNTGSLPLTVTAVELSSTQFAQANNCAAVAAGSSCAVSVTFTPAASTNASVPVNATLTVKTGAGDGSVSLFGTGERTLVTHYYTSILRRAPDAGGKAFWSAEAARVSALGVNVNEVWFALAQAFYFSAEYAALNRDNTGFISDLYNTFFNRASDQAGLDFWVGQLNGGMPREVALASFMFSTEFRNFTNAIYGNTAARAEVDAVTDFYRGLLARLPDDGGFNFWVGRFRTAQCAGQAQILAEVEAISSAYALSQEYTNRARTNVQYVGDLYNAFLRRGGDLAGVLFWINQVASGAQTREQVRVQFRNSPEFQARVQAIIAQGCLP